MNHHLNHELEIIIKVIKSASDLIQNIRSRDFEIKYKGDVSDPVTEADLAASDFLMNEINGGEEETMDIEPTVMEGRKKTGTKLCVRGKSAAKAKYDVYPSAYANGYAVQVCKGRMPGLDGKKHCSGSYC